ncbi:pantoate--beta-alanine ligase [Moraxella sp. FZLJ2107]|uniref:pantoate--beta-alanine ligase n=1 Tax=unclassified Moraxella TaxID=2685852 RepID=UPI00209C4455|nr:MULTISPECIES: pantoate--beta-alanine ligase [unclassified Moraxella]USZ13945.1 pantoate--beta-alanine ligase [Moraxella sp. FZFQ2102]UTO04306.1 pantoate--beta-alanine ligase [Moraxella sp. FZLJ2107]UTO23139.1 pantoate--beta-alanine ligase [Moraxella sp. FZLJ2109]
MQIFHSIDKLRQALSQASGKIALVPTMGNLHAGHLNLVKIAKAHADVVVVSIFVNPTQFGAGEDFDSYPRTLDADVTALETVAADFVFAPSVDEMYPTYPPSVQVLSGEITKLLCGKSRPTHFDGVGLVVSKLFNIVRPDIAVFGKKDYQQLAIIRQLNDELNFGIDIIGAEIVRADDGLALSSRNQYLTADERAVAPVLSQTLQAVAKALQTADIMDYDALIDAAKAKLQDAGFVVDYLEIYNQSLKTVSQSDDKLVILAAAWLGKARLLDNLEVVLAR